MKAEIRRRLAALRAEMKQLNLHAWYISGTDPHASEYLPERWKTREFISGFTGSYGVVVVTQNEAALWTDSRYFLQAAEQLEGTGIEMLKLRVPDALSPEEWIGNKLSEGSRVGMDAQTVSMKAYKTFETILAKKNISLVETADLFEKIWESRPLIPSNTIFELKTRYTGLSRKEKQQQLITETKKAGADYHLITMLDELAWQFNLRGSDISYNPVFYGFALIGTNESYLFIDKDKLDNKTLESLKKDGVVLKHYNAFYSFLSELKSRNIFIDTETANFKTYSKLLPNNNLRIGTSIISLLKARKNNTELEGFRKAMLKDGVAMIEFIFWLKNNVGIKQITAYDAGVKLKELRARQTDFQGESFSPIVGYKAQGAVVHLSVGPLDALPLEADGILLFDSGGQYFEGTTDITRTIALGKISEQQKNDYTLVLKGMIALSMAKFPYGTKGCHLDVLARKPLWEQGLNYGHGTGHGVGHFLNVHEGPMAIRQDYNPNMIEPGHVVSNEPALYREGEYGIRIENMIACIEIEETGHGKFLGFETLTLCPIDLDLVQKELLSPVEKSWLNNYHKKVKKALKPVLEEKYHRFLDELTRQI